MITSTGRNYKTGFTLIEVLLAMTILTVVIGAIYSTWAGVVKASRVGQEAAALSQRERMAIRVVEEALAGAQLFVADPDYYSFEIDNGGKVALSFVSSLPKAYPRSGKFGEALMRRVMFSVEPGTDNQKELVLRQYPILAEMDEDEQLHPVVLAQGVQKFSVEVWEPTKSEWVDEWLLTNQLPKMARVVLQLSDKISSGINVQQPLVTVVGLPTEGVQPSWQLPQPGGGPSPARQNPGGRQGVQFKR